MEVEAGEDIGIDVASPSRGVATRHAPVGRDDTGRVDDAVLVGAFAHPFNLPFDFLRVPPVVVAEDAVELPVGEVGRTVETVRDAAVLVVGVDPYPVVVGVAGERVTRPVGRAVVDDDCLDVVVRLVQDRLDGPCDELRAVVRRNQCAHQRHGIVVG